MNHLIKSLLLGSLFLIPRESAAQHADEYNKLSFSIRGKYLLGGFLEDLYWRTYHAGGEVFLGKHHAIGIDAGVFRTRRERDDNEDAAMYSDITRRSYIYMDYKYIHIFNRRFSLYGQVYSKILGKRKDWKEKHDYDFADTTDLSFLDVNGKATFTDIGLGVGCKFYFGESNFGFDVSLNVYKRFEKYDQTTFAYSDGEWWKTSSFPKKESSNPLYLRTTFFYHFMRFKKSK